MPPRSTRRKWQRRREQVNVTMNMQVLALAFLATAAVGGIAWVFLYPLLSGERKAESRRAALGYILEHDLTVAATDAYVDALLASPEPPPRKAEARRSFVMKDVRIFLNSVNHALTLMKQGGIAAGMRREETDEALILTISIPKNRSPT